MGPKYDCIKIVNTKISKHYTCLFGNSIHLYVLRFECNVVLHNILINYYSLQLCVRLQGQDRRGKVTMTINFVCNTRITVIFLSHSY